MSSLKTKENLMRSLRSFFYKDIHVQEVNTTDCDLKVSVSSWNKSRSTDNIQDLMNVFDEADYIIPQQVNTQL